MMKKKTVSGILLTLLLTGMLTLTLTPGIHPVRAEPGTWTVDDDGGADFSSIQEAIDSSSVVDGDTIYVYNGTYEGALFVSKGVLLIAESKNATIVPTDEPSHDLIAVTANNAAIQGFTIHGGIYLARGAYAVINTTIQENALVNGGVLIVNYAFGFNIIKNNTITAADEGIHIYSSMYNEIIGNTLINNDAGIILEGDCTTVTDNRIEGGEVGVVVSSAYNQLSGNEIADNRYNLGFGPSYRCYASTNDIDISNTINNRPVRFLVSTSDILVDPKRYPNPGFLALIDCENVTVRDFEISGNGQGILLQGGEGNTLVNNTLSSNIVGIEVISSNRTELTNNTVSDNGSGIWIIGSNMNTITGNDMKNNTQMIRDNLSPYARLAYRDLSYGFGWSSGALNVWSSSSNQINGNTMVDGDFGILLVGSSSNSLRNNAMTGNIMNFALDFSVGSSQSIDWFGHDIDDSNTVDGRPIIYWVSQQEMQVPENAGFVAIVNCTDVTVTNLNISNNLQGILVVSSNNSTISRNNIANCPSGITILQGYEPTPSEIWPSTNITISNNTAFGCSPGLSLLSGEEHAVIGNDFSHNLVGIELRDAEKNIISRNTIINCTIWGYAHDRFPDGFWGTRASIYMGPVGLSVESSGNIITENTIGYNFIGIAVGVIDPCDNNTIYHNNFINNTEQANPIAGHPNAWDNGFPSGGNYWSDYAGTDLMSGPNQEQPNSDGIGDTPYKIDGGNTDRFPLMGPISSFDAGTWGETTYHVDTVSSSVISDFDFSQDNKLISFNVTGPNGTVGFCKVTIPNFLLGGPYVVLVNDSPPLTISEWTDGTHTFLYFTYNHSVRPVEISGTTAIPEFPTWIPLLLLLSVISVTVVIYKQRLLKTPPD